MPELWFNRQMRKTEAIALLGGSVLSAARAIGVTYQAVGKWPEELPQRIADRVQGALWRIANGVPHPATTQPSPAAEEANAEQSA